MARTIVNAQQVTKAGVAPVFNAATATDGDGFSNDGNSIIEAKNASGASVDLTITTPGTVDGNAIADLVVTIPAGATRVIGRLAPAAYNIDGYVWMNWSAVTSVTFAVYRI